MYLPMLMFKFVPDITEVKKSPTVFLIAEPEDHQSTAEQLVSNSTTIKLNLTRVNPDHIDSGDILTCAYGNNFFSIDKENACLSRIEKSIIKSMVNM